MARIILLFSFFMIFMMNQTYSQKWRNFLFGDHSYLIEGWNRSGKIDTKSIVLTSTVINDFNQNLLNHLKQNLEKKNLEVLINPIDNTTYKALIINIKDIGSNKRLISMKAEPTTCREFIISQHSYFPFGEKHLINSKVYIAENNFIKSTEDCATELAKLIYQSIK